MKHKLWMELAGTMSTALFPVKDRKQYSDLLRQAQEQTVPMFAVEPVTEDTPPQAVPSPQPPPIEIRGFRARARAASVPVRRRAY